MDSLSSYIGLIILLYQKCLSGMRFFGVILFLADTINYPVSCVSCLKDPLRSVQGKVTR